MSETALDRASEYAHAKLQEAGGRIAALAVAIQTLVVVESAQGIIDNGGLEYFYESDFVDAPPYSFFVEAYRRIGAESVASCIEATSRMFPFPEPHLHESKRQRWLDGVREDEQHEFFRLSQRACGDASVFVKLADYVERNKETFNAT